MKIRFGGVAEQEYTVSYGKSKKRKIKEKKMKQTNKCALILCMAMATVIVLTSSGCANQATAKITAGADLTKIHKIHVEKFDPDKRGINVLISDQLTKMGYESTTGAASEKPANVDAIATYRDKWMWDITMYMLDLTITLREPQGEYPLAVGHSMHTSLTRKSPEKMVEEVLTNIFKQPK